MKRGTRALGIVVLATALVLTPLVLGGVFLGFYLGSVTGYSKTILAIALSTLGFVVGMAVLFRVIKAAVAGADPARN